VRAANALKCTFSGVLSIAPQHFLDSGLTQIECIVQMNALRSVTREVVEVAGEQLVIELT
jgi:hypothetical protein